MHLCGDVVAWWNKTSIGQNWLKIRCQARLVKPRTSGALVGIEKITVTNPIVPLIMCGGAGTRLWPASREGLPKQFLPLFGRLSTFQETIRRVSDPALFGRPIIITNSQYRFLIAEQLAEIGTQADILLDPAR